MGGITGSFAVTVGGGLSGAGTPASPLSTISDPTVYGGVGSHVIAAISLASGQSIDANTTFSGATLLRQVDVSIGNVNMISGYTAPATAGAIVGNITATTSLSLTGTWRTLTKMFNNNASSLSVLVLCVRVA